MISMTVGAARPYTVHLGHGLLGEAGRLAARVHPPCAVALAADDTVAELYMERAAAAFEAAGFRVARYRFAPGEGAKSMEGLALLLDFLARSGLGRGDLVAALGGGVAGDLAGFAAACFQRGVAYVQLPTTLLAAVDSSVGGKTAVNLPSGKNLAGAFWQPSLVVCDCDTLTTLPRAELAAGAAECVKYALLGRPELLDTLTREGLQAPWEMVIADCVAHKARVVEADERETGERLLLNLGHTVGHAAERLSGYRLRHGEGVAMGMAVITRAAEGRGLCQKGTAARLEAALRALELPTACPYGAGELARAALADKKRRGDRITLVVPQAVGRCAALPVPVDQLEGWIASGMEGGPCG